MKQETKQVDVQAIQSRVEKRTPGRWYVNSSGTQVINSLGACIAECYDRGSETPCPKANAELIAAAPDLLSALSDAEGIVREMAKALEDARLTMVINDINRCDFEDIEELLSRPSVEKLLREMK